ncbi:MAG: ankyrin repeat domain-containing protein [Desulfarculus sp.]|nr:ankyrin repeat domain-containing protein [Desulfarculus sp.]
MRGVRAIIILATITLVLASGCSPVPPWNQPPATVDDKSLEMSLWEAARGCDPLSLSALIRAGADVNAAKGARASTPLMEAARAYGPECPVNSLRILLERGAKIDLTDQNGNTVLHYLAEAECTSAYDQAALMLLRAGADPLVRNKAGLDPITVAAQRGCNTRVALMAEMVAAKKSHHTRPGGPQPPPAPKSAGGGSAAPLGETPAPALAPGPQPAPPAGTKP